MGMFKDMRNLTRQAQDLKKSTDTPGMGEMIKQASSQMSDLKEQQQGAPDLIANGEPGKEIVKAIGTPARPGAELPLKVEREDPAKIAIDWDQIEKPADRGEIRPA